MPKFGLSTSVNGPEKCYCPNVLKNNSIFCTLKCPGEEALSKTGGIYFLMKKSIEKVSC